MTTGPNWGHGRDRRTIPGVRRAAAGSRYPSRSAPAADATSAAARRTSPGSASSGGREAPLGLVGQLRPETLEDDGETELFRGGRGLLRRCRRPTRPRPERRIPSTPPWTPASVRALRLRFGLSDHTQLRSSNLPLRGAEFVAPDSIPRFLLTTTSRLPYRRRPPPRPSGILVDHPPVEFVEFLQHRVLLCGAEVVEDGVEEVLVLLLDVTRIKGDEFLQALGDLGKRSLHPQDSGSWPRRGA